MFWLSAEVCEDNSSIMFYGSSSGASMSLPSKNRIKRQSKTFTQVRAHKRPHFRSQEAMIV